MVSSLETVAYLCGWTSCISLVTGLFVQNIKNYRVQSCLGYSTDFALIAWSGFVCLLFNQVTGRVDLHSEAGRIHIVDIVFAAGCMMSSSVAVVQCWIYPSDPPYLSTRLIWYGVMALMVIGGVMEGQFGLPMTNYLGVSWVVYGALAKAASTFVKYYFQITLNYQKKSAGGVSAYTCMFDFTGCFLNLIQMQIDSSRAGYGLLLFDKRLNLGKFLLTVISGCSDIVLLIQYYVVYPYASAQLDQSQSFI
jgi:hypothetical protein